MSLQADPFLQQAGKLTSAELTEHAEQGFSVALSADGNTALIGGWFYKSGEGAAWVYARSGSTWTEQAKLVGSEASKDAQQGFSVALSADGDTAVIGGPEDEGASKTFPGAAWVFTRSGATWTEQQKLVGTSATMPSAQGHGVALSADGDTALIGGDEDNKGVGAGWVFTREAGKWTQQGAKLVGAHTGSLLQQGWSVALSGSGDTALIGGPRTGGEKGEKEAGAAWVFTRSGSTWKEQEKLPSGTGAGEEAAQGQSVALSGDADTALIGGPGFDKALGAAWVYALEGGKWVQQGEKLLGEDAATEPQQGVSVSLSEDGDTALVGGYHDDTSVGAAWAFVRSGSTWGEQQKLVGTGSTGGFPTQGTGVALSGDGATALVGGAGDDSGVGAAWVFTRTIQSGGEPEGKGSPPNNGPPSTQTPSSAAVVGAAAVAGIASTPQAIEELLLGCSKHDLVLNDVFIRAGRVAISGSAAKSLVGKRVKILFNERGQVATATVGANGQYATTAPLPPARIREALDTRYTAEIGSERSLHVKLTRRLLQQPPKVAATTVTLTGLLTRPLTKPIAPVVVEQQLECGRTTIVKRFTPPANGRFRVTVTVPASARAGIFTLKSKVAANARSTRHGFTTYSLPLPAILG
jgi:FG-GAP repeat